MSSAGKAVQEDNKRLEARVFSASVAVSASGMAESCAISLTLYQQKNTRTTRCLKYCSLYPNTRTVELTQETVQNPQSNGLRWSCVRPMQSGCLQCFFLRFSVVSRVYEYAISQDVSKLKMLAIVGFFSLDLLQQLRSRLQCGVFFFQEARHLLSVSNYEEEC